MRSQVFRYTHGYVEYHAMRPLLILPPAPARWSAFQNLLAHQGPLWLRDAELRFAGNIESSSDAYAVVVNGGHMLACAGINARDGVGVLGHLFTRPEHRMRGMARKVITTLLSWFDMTGGRRLYVGCHAELMELFAKFGFEVLHRNQQEPINDVTMWRRAKDVGDSPMPEDVRQVRVRDVTRADWPQMVALLQHCSAADPRVTLQESAVSAELACLELLTQQDDGKCRLMAAWHESGLIGLGSFATEKADDRTYAMIMPHDRPLPTLREALVAEAKAKGYAKVEFPMESLGETVAPPAATDG